MKINHYTPTRMTMSKRLTAPNADKDVEQLGTLQIVSMNIKQTHQFEEEIWQLSYNLSCTPRYLPNRKETTYSHTQMFTQLFTAAFLQRLGTENSSGVEEWSYKLLTYAVPWVNLKKALCWVKETSNK